VLLQESHQLTEFHRLSVTVWVLVRQRETRARQQNDRSLWLTVASRTPVISAPHGKDSKLRLGLGNGGNTARGPRPAAQTAQAGRPARRPNPIIRQGKIRASSRTKSMSWPKNSRSRASRPCAASSSTTSSGPH
jgi:hypothetical protein